MTAETRSRYTLGFGYAAAITALASGVLTIAKEKHEPLLAWMKSVSVHHWVTHGIAVLMLFAILGLVLSMRGSDTDPEPAYGRLATMLAAATVLGGALVGVLYLLDAIR